MNIKPIHTKTAYKQALKRIEALWGATPNTPKGDELDILATLVEAYEEQHYPILPPDPVEAIKFRMEQMGLSNIDVVPYLGTRSRVSEILNRKRPLTYKMACSLHRGLHIPADALLS